MPPSITLPPRTINFAKDLIHIEIEGDKFTGAGPYQEDVENLALYVQLYQEQNAQEQFLSEKAIKYSNINKKAFFDFSTALRVEHSTPDKQTLKGTDIATGDPIGTTIVDNKAACKFSFKFADQYGSPANPEETLVNSGDYYAISGATRYQQGPYQTSDSVLHSYYNESGKVIFKEVRKTEPDLWYLFPVANRSITLKARFVYTDNTEVAEVAIFSANIEALKVNYFACGYNQINLDSHIDVSKDLAYYELYITGGIISRTEGARYYYLDDRAPDNENYLAYTNGCGGVEIVRISGYPKLNSNANKSLFIRPKTSTSNYQDGHIGTLNLSGHDAREWNTGYYSEDYIIHLRQLLLADVWMIRPERGDYYKVALTDVSLPIYDRSKDKFSLAFNIREDDVHSFTTFRL